MSKALKKVELSPIEKDRFEAVSRLSKLGPMIMKELSVGPFDSDSDITMVEGIRKPILKVRGSMKAMLFAGLQIEDVAMNLVEIERDGNLHYRVEAKVKVSSNSITVGTFLGVATTLEGKMYKSKGGLSNPADKLPLATALAQKRAYHFVAVHLVGLSVMSEEEYRDVTRQDIDEAKKEYQMAQLEDKKKALYGRMYTACGTKEGVEAIMLHLHPSGGQFAPGTKKVSEINSESWLNRVTNQFDQMISEGVRPWEQQ